jgi:hypothetical protein
MMTICHPRPLRSSYPPELLLHSFSIASFRNLAHQVESQFSKLSKLPTCSATPNDGIAFFESASRTFVSLFLVLHEAETALVDLAIIISRVRQAPYGTFRPCYSPTPTSKRCICGKAAFLCSLTICKDLGCQNARKKVMGTVPSFTTMLPHSKTPRYSSSTRE